MSKTKRQIHLGVFWLGTGDHAAGWRWEGAFTSNASWPAVERGAKIAERGKLDMFFISDSMTANPSGDHPSFITRFEPTTLVGALGAVTRNVGLGATVSTTFSQPYVVARTFQTLQHITGGRIAWNVVTSTTDGAAQNFGMEKITEHDKRYEIAEEFVDVVRKLWESWEPDALVMDKKTGVYADDSKIHRINHKGRHFSVRGPLNLEQSPHGNPLIVQAGGSVPGQELSARTADVVFSVVNGDKVGAKKAYDELKARVVKHGRDPETVKILPGVMPIIGRTNEEAKAHLDRLQSWLSPSNAMELVSQRVGHDLKGYDLDGPVPEFEQTNKGQAFSRALLDLARREKMTLRDLYNITAAARGHWVIYGTPKRIADILEEWFTERLGDGFVIMPAYFPGAFDDFVDHVVPELQRRGLYRKEYAGSTMRHHFGLVPPE